jgi:peptidoglycan/xylan/chitin deacetylase (PgdA/CDA1 family)
VRVVALIASHNERRFIGSCLEHLCGQGVESYLIDDGSTDETVEIAEGFLDRGLIGIEELARRDTYDWRGPLRRKEELARELDADWFIHLDPDEVRLPPSPDQTLAQALEVVDSEGYNALNFFEFTFVPTREEPDHDHGDFQQTLRTYYPFAPKSPHQLKAWKAAGTAELARFGGHRVSFPDLRMYPEPFPMKHYLFLSVPHAIEKYLERDWHGWRARITEADLGLPSRSELRVSRSDEDLDPGGPRTRHCLVRVLVDSESKGRLKLAGLRLHRSGPREETLADVPGAAKIVHRGGGERPEVALTFDDGPARWTAPIAAAFEEHGCRATFFACGAAVEERPETVAALAASGHEIGNHLWSHPDASTLRQAELRVEIERAAEAIEATGAPRPKLVRPPYFNAPRAVAEAAAGTGTAVVIQRSIGSSDWAAEWGEGVFRLVFENVEPGDIVCMHDGVSPERRDTDSRESTVVAVRRLVPALLERGLRPVTVSELLRPGTNRSTADSLL